MVKGGATGSAPPRRGTWAEQDGSPVYQAQHAEKVSDVNHGVRRATTGADNG